MEITQAIKTRQLKGSPYKPEWGRLVYERRIALNETQTQFGARFDVTATAVSLWEAGERDVPGKVTWWLVHTTVIKPTRAKVLSN